jgi:predicted GIY-YIG superfamily endonuclease
MKKHYVYELVNLMGTVEYVGETNNPRLRYNSHKCKSGNFYKRADIILNVAKEFYNKNEAWDYQCLLQNEYGLLSDRDKIVNQRTGSKHTNKTKKRISKLLKINNSLTSEIKSLGGKAGLKAQNVELKCPHCNHIGTGRIMYRWHFDKCKNKV